MTMDRAIFDMNLSVEATSLYILICSNTVGNQGPSMDVLNPIWNGAPDQLEAAAEELIRHGILMNTAPIPKNEPLLVSGNHCWSKP